MWDKDNELDKVQGIDIFTPPFTISTPQKPKWGFFSKQFITQRSVQGHAPHDCQCTICPEDE